MGARVLVVDDDPWILRMVTASLEKRSYVVDTAKEGRQALQRAEAHPPDVIVSDVMMPVMDGWTFVQHLRQNPRLSGIPVIFLTALGKDEARLRSLGLGPDQYIAKPFRFDELEKRVSQALKNDEEAEAPAPPYYPAPAPVTSGPGYPGFAYPYPQGYPYPAPGYPYPPGYPPPAPPAPNGYGPPPYPQGGPGGAPPPTRSEAGDGKPPARRRVENEAAAAVAGPSSEASSDSLPAQRRTALNGRLEQLQLSSLLVMMEMERKDGLLTLKAKGGDMGRIFLRRGQVVSARLENAASLGGRECVYEMLRWRSGNFSFNAMEVDMDDTVQSSTTHLLMEGARLIDEANRDGP